MKRNKNTHIFKKCHLIIYMMAVATLTVQAQQKTMGLDDCLRMAAQHNLSLKSGQLAVGRALDMEHTSFDIDPTSVTLGQDPTSGGSPDNAVTVGQTFSMPVVYTRKRKQLKAETEVERRRLESAEADVRREVTLAYMQLVYEYERLAQYGRLDSLYGSFHKVASAKNEAGETGRLEHINADRMVRENEINLQNTRRDYRIAQLQLMQWLNTDTLIVPADLVLQPMEAHFSAVNDGSESLPVKLADSQIKASEAALKSVKSEALPTVSLSASTQLVIKGFNPYDIDRSAYDKGSFMGFEVGLNIPLAFGAQRGKVRAAKKDVEMARMEREQQLHASAQNYRVKLIEYEKAKTLLDYYEKEAVNQAKEMDRISQTSYEHGSIDYVELMQNMQSVTEVYMSQAQAVYDYNKAVVELNYLLNR